VAWGWTAAFAEVDAEGVVAGVQVGCAIYVLLTFTLMMVFMD
jgi:hypothetical protein